MANHDDTTPLEGTSMPLYLINATMSVGFFAMIAMIGEILWRSRG
jgi:hypothetical protein